MCTTFCLFFFFARTAEEITHQVYNRVRGFLQSQGSVFSKRIFFAKICVFVENVHLENNNKVDCKNFEEHSRLCFPIMYSACMTSLAAKEFSCFKYNKIYRSCGMC